MDDEEITPSETSRPNDEVKTELPEKPSSDSTPLQKASQSEVKESSTVVKENNGGEKNGQKRIKMEPNDGSSKKPRITPDSSATVKKRISTESENMSDTEEYYLTVSNMPSDWSYVQIKNFLDKECGHVDEMEMLNKDNTQGCAIRLTFQSLQKCKEVQRKLEHRVIQDKVLIVDMTEPISVFPPGVTVPEAPSMNKNAPDIKKEPLRPWKKEPETTPPNLYGLRPEYLTALNIVPPLTKLLHVSNFRCDKNELKEVMELAGNVLMCCVVSSAQKYAKVMYNHPLEAVQAISMLNGQMYYGSPLRITMDKNLGDTIVLPKGLASVGLGLGLQGKPIRNIEKQYQKYTKNQSSLVNPIIFSKINSSDKSSIIEDNQEEIQSKINEFMKSAPMCTVLNHTTSFKIKNIDQFETPETISKDGSDRSTPETTTTKQNVGGSRKSSVGSLSPNRDPLTKNGAEINHFNKPLPSLVAPTQTPMVRICQSSKPIIRPSLLHNPPVPMHNPMPIPTPGHPNYGPPGAPVNFANQPRPGQFGPRPVPFMPSQRPGFGPQSMPPFGPPGVRPQMPPANFSGARPFVSPNTAVPRPNINPGNRVTVNFSNLPPSTTFPLLCEQLSQCGQVMSVQLTTPGCAVATFGHPSHAEKCYQTFNRMNIEGYIIEVKFA